MQQDVTDPTIFVGSGYEWTGSGREPQWNNPKSTKAYDHINVVTVRKKASQTFWWAASTREEQGQWLKAETWVEAEKLTPKHPGQYIIDFKYPIGRVYCPDGSIIESVTKAVIIRKKDGTLKSAYPVTDSAVLKSQWRGKINE